MNQFLCRQRRLQTAIAFCRHFAQANAQRNDQIRSLKGALKIGIHANAHITNVILVSVIKNIMVPPGSSDRQFPMAGELMQSGTGFWIPVSTPGDKQGPFRLADDL